MNVTLRTLFSREAEPAFSTHILLETRENGHKSRFSRFLARIQALFILKRNRNPELLEKQFGQLVLQQFRACVPRAGPERLRPCGDFGRLMFEELQGEEA